MATASKKKPEIKKHQERLYTKGELKDVHFLFKSSDKSVLIENILSNPNMKKLVGFVRSESEKMLDEKGKKVHQYHKTSVMIDKEGDIIPKLSSCGCAGAYFYGTCEHKLKMIRAYLKNRGKIPSGMHAGIRDSKVKSQEQTVRPSINS